MGVEISALEPEPIAALTIPAGYSPLRVFLPDGSLFRQGLSWFIQAISTGRHANRDKRFDLVYSTNNNIFNMVVSYGLAKILSLPTVIVVHHLRWIDYREDAVRGNNAKFDASRFFRFLRGEGVGVVDSLARVAGGLVESKILSRFDRFIVVSRSVAVQLGNLVPSNRIATIENAPFNSAIVSTRPEARGNYALSVGRIDEGKGTIDLLAVWRDIAVKCPPARLEIVGDGSLRRRMELECRNMGLDGTVRFRGFLDDGSVMKLQSESRLFMTLSRTEGFSMAVAEALAAGLPVVAWDIPPLREVFGSCPSVFLCRQDDIGKIVSTSVELLTLPENDWQHLSKKASEFARRFSWQASAEKELKVLERTRRV